jgi:hypothetical protein
MLDLRLPNNWRIPTLLMFILSTVLQAALCANFAISTFHIYKLQLFRYNGIVLDQLIFTLCFGLIALIIKRNIRHGLLISWALTLLCFWKLFGFGLVPYPTWVWSIRGWENARFIFVLFALIWITGLLLQNINRFLELNIKSSSFVLTKSLGILFSLGLLISILQTFFAYKVWIISKGNNFSEDTAIWAELSGAFSRLIVSIIILKSLIQRKPHCFFIAAEAILLYILLNGITIFYSGWLQTFTIIAIFLFLLIYVVKSLFDQETLSKTFKANTH